MRHVTRLGVAVVVVSVLAACRGDSPVQQSVPTLNALISDGAHFGNKDFFFVPPLVPNPSALFDPGQFNAALLPLAEVCELTATDVLSLATSDCKSAARVFGPATMTLDGANEHYRINWDTEASLLNPTSFYRIMVRGAPKGMILGFVDVDPVLGGMKNAKTGDVFIFQDGRTLPIKVRIEQGAFGSSNASDRVEQVVPNILPATGLDVTTNTFFAGAHFTNGWLANAGLDQVVVIIERLGVNDGSPATSCLNTPLEQLEGCYRFKTDPDLHTLIPGRDIPFASEVIVGMCFQFPADIENPNQHPFELHRSEELGEGLGPATPLLDERAAPFLRCDGFTATPPSIGAALKSGNLGDVVKAGWFAVSHGIARVAQPKALYAVDAGAGGSTAGFSRFGFARRARMTAAAGDGATAPAGSTVQASVSLDNIHHGVPSPIVGQSVTFTVKSGGGTVSAGTCSEANSCSTTSDGTGHATVTWRLGLGTNTLEASTGEVLVSPVVLTATGTEVGPLSIAFHSTRDLGDFEIYSMNLDGTAQTRLTENVGSDFGPSISPDGSKIAFGRFVGDAEEIWVINANGTGETQLTKNNFHDAGPEWSPDGTKIAFRSTRDGNFEIYVMNADGTGQTRLTDNPARDFDIAWAPGGSKIAFDSERDGPSFHIYLMNPDGTGVVQLTSGPENDVTPSFSPDGRKIVFTHGAAQVWVMNADGTNPHVLAASGGFDGEPSWCLDGRIAFSSNRDGNFQIYIMNADGTGQTRLTNNTAMDREPFCGRGQAVIP